VAYLYIDMRFITFRAAEDVIDRRTSIADVQRRRLDDDVQVRIRRA